MKNVLTLGLSLFFAGGLLLTNVAQASSSSYWDFYRQYYSNKNSAYSSSRVGLPRYRYSSRRTTRNVYPSYTRSRSSNYRVYPTTRTRLNPRSSQDLKVTVTPIKLRQDINEITQAPVDLFQIGLSYPAGSRNTFSPAAQVRTMQFQIVDNTGVVSDFSDFDLVVEDQDFQFERNGYITLQFSNLRIARGQSRPLDVQIRLNDPDTFARQRGSFRVKLTDLTAVQENTVQGVGTAMSGRTVSDYVVLNPRPSVSGGAANGTASATPVKIFGRALGAGETAPVLSVKLEASRDDFLVEGVTVRNTFGDNIDSLVQEVRLINQTTGRVLQTKRFTGGAAVFDLSTQNQIYIARNTSAVLVFEVVVRDNLPSSITDNRLELSFTDSDIEIFGIGSGRAVPDSSKHLNVDTETFTVNQGGGSGTAAGGISFSATQPSFITHSTLEQIVRFQVRNAGNGAMSLGRISLQTLLAGVAYTGGQSVDDAQLVRVINGFQERPSGFVTTAASGDVFVFDSSAGEYLAPGEVQEYALKLKLDNTGSFSDSDAVSVKILGDSSFVKDDLAGVRSSGANFIWSDHAGSPHSTTSNDWLSGYLVSGLPTGNFVRKRE